MKNLRLEVIKHAKMLNSKKLSALRSGNISARYKDGFLITPSGVKYSSLKNKDIVFVPLKGEFDKKKGIPSSEWRFHQDIYMNKSVIIKPILKGYGKNKYYYFSNSSSTAVIIARIVFTLHRMLTLLCFLSSFHQSGRDTALTLVPSVTSSSISIGTMITLLPLLMLMWRRWLM